MANKKLAFKNIMARVPDSQVTDLYLNSDPFNDVVLPVKHTLGLNEAMLFVRNVVGTCVDDEDVEYMPELFDFAVRMYVLIYYAGVEVPKDMDKAYRVLYCTDLYEKVIDLVDQAQFVTLTNSAHNRIEHWKRTMEVAVANKVSELIEKVGELLEGNKDILEKIDDGGFMDAVSRLAELGVAGNTDSSDTVENMSIMDDITDEEVDSAEAIMTGILKGEITENENTIYIPKK